MRKGGGRSCNLLDLRQWSVGSVILGGIEGGRCLGGEDN